MTNNSLLDIQPEVKAALDAGKAVVALESTIISHGMPYRKMSRWRGKWSQSSAAPGLCQPLSPS
jgi:pseudouridine-5'-phosphate glycosidase